MRSALAALALAAGLTGAAASALGAAPVTTVPDCVRQAVRPDGITLACGDGGFLLTGLRWSTTTPAVARARGTAVLNLCDPNCAAGRKARYAVQAVFANPSACPGMRRQFRRLTLIADADRPARTPRVRTVPLPCVPPGIG